MFAGVLSPLKRSHAARNAAKKPSYHRDEADAEQNPEDTHNVSTILKFNNCFDSLFASKAVHND